jgi:hypothetical protein
LKDKAGCKRQKVKTYFLPVYLGFEARQRLASNHVKTRLKTNSPIQVSLPFPKKTSEAVPFGRSDPTQHKAEGHRTTESGSGKASQKLDFTF